MIKEEDPTRPIVSVYGDPSGFAYSTYPALSNCLDGWGFNIYRAGFTTGGDYDGTSGFGGDLGAFAEQAPREFRFVGEYGIDAFNAHTSTEVESQQATAISNMMRELYYSNGWQGGFVFEWQDEWWKAAPYSEQNAGGWPQPCGRENHPACIYSEDWWGLVRADHSPREAVARYTTTKNELLSAPRPPPAPPSPPPAPPAPPAPPPASYCCSACAGQGGVGCSSGQIDAKDIEAANGYGTCGAQIAWCQGGLGEARCGAEASSTLSTASACQYIALNVAYGACDPRSSGAGLYI